ncbi:MAG: hypothetical protein JJT94_02400, partial [Bernardetiaceae bacterium]|nr:hypothetical protein [Bernardetiaceae bacterium]
MTQFITKKLFLSVLFCLISYLAEAQVRYVKPTATGTGDGSSWANASNDLQAMINASAAGEQVWVAAGTYKPTQYPTGCGTCANPRQYTFSLKSGVELYGGFAGTEVSIAARNNFAPTEANETILSGDLADNDDFGDDGYQGTTGDDNVYHVVTSTFTTAGHTTILDGFSIRGGHAGSAPWSVDGAGINARLDAAATQIFRNNSIYHNQAWFRGGGLYIFNNSPSGEFIYENNNINDNIVRRPPIPNATTYGAGIFAVNQNGGTQTFDNNNIFNNKNLGLSTSSQGVGGFIENRNSGLFDFTNNTIHHNSAPGQNRGGGLAIISYTNSIVNFSDNIVHDNVLTAPISFGAGIYFDNRSGGALHTIRDNLFYNNSVGQGGGGMYINSGLFLTEQGDYVVERNVLYNNVARFGGAIRVESRGLSEMLFQDNQIYDNIGIEYGGGIMTRNNYGASQTFINNDIYNNSCTSNQASGGGVYAWNIANGDSCTYVFTNNRIHDNNAGNPGANLLARGGGVWGQNSNGGSFVFTDNEVYNNTASNGGGGMILATYTNGISTVSNNAFYNNTAPNGNGLGGGLRLDAYSGGLNFFLNNEIYDNTANNFGGGVHATSGNNGALPGTNNFENNNIYNNSTTSNSGRGGGIYALSQDLGIHIYTNNNIYDNSTYVEGGGIYAYNNNLNAASGTQTYTGNNIYNNSVSGSNTSSGGGMYVRNVWAGGLFNVSNNTIYDNTVTGNAATGGGISAIDSHNGNVQNYTNNTVYNNTVSGTSGRGGGIYASGSNATQTFIANSIYNNSANNQGGGLHASITGVNGTQTFIANSIRNNSTTNQGAGIYAQNSNGANQNYFNNTVHNNSGANLGGGLYSLNQSTAPQNYINNTFYNNSANTQGGGVYVTNSSAGATQNYLNNIFWENQQNGSNDVAGADIIKGNTMGTLNVEYCIVQANTLYTPSGVNNNIFQDPLFVDAAAGNLRLQTSSIAVDSGSDDAWAITGLDTDKDGEERPKFCVVDRGAFELQ